MCETMFFFSVQVCLDPWTVQPQADLQMYLFLGRKGMFLCFYVKKIVPVDMASPLLQCNHCGLCILPRYPVGGISNFVQTFFLNPNFLLVHRNRYSEGMDDGQKTPRGHPDFNSYVKILRVFIDNGRTNRQTDGQTDGEINPVWAG
jgi:hypothetical protein